MTDFNYDAPAEFYGRRGQGVRRGVVTYRRFTTAAEAIRHAIEDVSSAVLGSCALEANGQRIQGRDILTLYTNSRFPLKRASPSGVDRGTKAFKRYDLSMDGFSENQ